MQKVLHIFNGLQTGGVESFVITLQKALCNDGIQFDFLLRTTENDAQKIAYFSERGSHIFITSPWQKHPLKNYREMKRFFAAHRDAYDFIHIHANSLAYFLPIQFAATYMKRAKIIVHSHNTRGSGSVADMLHYIHKVRLAHYTVTNLACSDAAGKWLFSKSYTVIPNSIDAERYRITAGDVQQRNAAVVLLVSVGRLTRQKNYDFALAVMKLLRDDGLAFHYAIAGDGDLRPALEEKIRRLGLQNQVTLLGNVADIPALLKTKHIFLMPSLFEGLSIALLEAQCSGIASVIADTIPQEGVLCDNVHRIPLEERVWAETIKAICQQENFGFNAHNTDIIAESPFGLAGLRKTMLTVYTN